MASEIELITEDDPVIISWGENAPRRRTCCGRCVARVYSHVGRQLDSMLLVLDSTTNRTVLPSRAWRYLWRLRLPMALYTVFASLSVSVSFVFAVKSIYILATHGKQSWMCQPLEVWLMVCCAALTLSALTLGITDILVVAWSMRGEFIRANLPETCRDTGPDIWSFPDEALGVGIFAFVCALMCVMTGWYMVRQLRRIHDFVADTEIQRTINSLALFTHTNADPACSICLDDTESNAVWRRLPCNHSFHQRCLSEWLRSSGLCPSCEQHIEARSAPPAVDTTA